MGKAPTGRQAAIAAAPSATPSPKTRAAASAATSAAPRPSDPVSLENWTKGQTLAALSLAIQASANAPPRPRKR